MLRHVKKGNKRKKIIYITRELELGLGHVARGSDAYAVTFENYNRWIGLEDRPIKNRDDPTADIIETLGSTVGVLPWTAVHLTSEILFFMSINL